MTKLHVMAGLAITSLVTATPAMAQGRSGAHAGGGTTAVHGRPATGPSTATHGKSGDTSHGQSAEGTHGKSGGHDTDTDTDTDSPSNTHAHANGTHPAGGPSSIADKISRNPQQLARVTAMLDGTGLSLSDATAGFRNQGQFIAALNASKNQHIAFADLQKAMTQDGLSLGEAVRKLKPAPAPTTTTDTSSPTTKS